MDYLISYLPLMMAALFFLIRISHHLSNISDSLREIADKKMRMMSKNHV